MLEVGPKNLEIAKQHLAVIEDLMATSQESGQFKLTAWERDFLVQLVDRLKRRNLSEAEIRVLSKMRAKFSRTAREVSKKADELSNKLKGLTKEEPLPETSTRKIVLRD